MSGTTHSPTRRGARNELIVLSLAGALLLAACSGPAVLIAGESIRPPDPPPPEFQVAVLAGDDLTPLPALVQVGEDELVADQAGRVVLTWHDEPLELTAAAPGFHPASTMVEVLPADGPVELRLSPVVLTGQVLGPDGRPLPHARVTLGDHEAVTDLDGEFRMIRATPGEINVTRPAWEPVAVTWDGRSGEVTISMEPRMVRALRVQARRTGDPETWEQMLRLADETEVNALVIDTKDERGNVYHDTEVALAHEVGAVQALYDLDEVIADMDEHGLYKITRIVTFQDPWLARARPELAITDRRTGGPWETYSGRAWLDPTDRDAWEYPLALAEEACRRGFDEIQFDYVRFPSDGPVSRARYDRGDLRYEEYYTEPAQEFRVKTIAAFLSEAHTRLNAMGCAVAADIFAITLESRGSDEGIGQLPGPLSASVDVLSPMIYSYAYGPGWKGCEDPNDCAPLIVAEALDAGLPQLEGFGIFRPWLQRAFLDAEEVLAVQGEAEERELGWMLWSENTSFDASMLEPER